MTTLTLEQIRNFRLRAHHLDADYDMADIAPLVGACGMQNTPPGAWETALFNRVPTCSLTDMERLLYRDKSLVQAWSLRGTPVVFPTAESDTFLSALRPEAWEPWIYTQGIGLALDFLQMSFEDLLALLMNVMPQLDDTALVSKTTLDQTLADWMLPLIPADKQDLWKHPSMYGSPDKQTVGGAIVSFLLRPCAFHGLVVFGERDGIHPTFTSYQSWVGHPLHIGEAPAKKLVEKYLHCYGPTTPDALATWLGCSGKQARRMWETVSDHIEPVTVSGRKAYILSADKAAFLSPAPLQKELLLLGGHDPYLDQRDRQILQPDKSLHKQIWKMVSNPGAIVHRGEIIGIWTSKKKGSGMEIKMTLWETSPDKKKLQELAEAYAAFRQQTLLKLQW